MIPSPDQLAALMLLLEGTEIRNLVAPYKATGKPVNIDTLEVSVGPVRRTDPDAGARYAEDERAGRR